MGRRTPASHQDLALDLNADTGTLPLPKLAHFSRGLLQSVSHAHFTVHRRRDGEALLAQLKVARAAKQFAETQVAVRNKRAHAARLGERQRLAVVSLAALGIQLLRMGRDVAEQVERMGREALTKRRQRNGAITKMLCLARSVEQQITSPQRAVGPEAMTDYSLRCVAPGLRTSTRWSLEVV